MVVTRIYLATDLPAPVNVLQYNRPRRQLGAALFKVKHFDAWRSAGL